MALRIHAAVGSDDHYGFSANSIVVATALLRRIVISEVVDQALARFELQHAVVSHERPAAARQHRALEFRSFEHRTEKMHLRNFPSGANASDELISIM